MVKSAVVDDDDHDDEDDDRPGIYRLQAGTVMGLISSAKVMSCAL